MPVEIDEERLWQSLMTLAEVGAYADARTGLRGVDRLALTDADGAGRDLVKGWFAAQGLEVRVDRIGNVYGRRPGARDELAPVLSGSHIDSVPTGGAFDGTLGVLGALEVVRALDAAGVETTRPIEIAFFTDEEGARFGTDMLGSAVAAGRLALDDAWSLRDETGATVKGELQRLGYLGEAPPRLAPPHAFVEVHIEQGPVLAKAQMDLGVVTGVQAISWQTLNIAGRSAHAGTTPMELRADAGLVAALVNVRLHEMVASARFGRDMRCTMGRVVPEPNRVNIVPGKVSCTVDLRNPFDDFMQKAEEELSAYLDELEAEHDVTIERRQTARTQSVSFDEGVQARLGAAMDARGLRWTSLISGAGHDAQEMAALCPTAMVFVPGEHDGISHNPREYSSPAACARGVQILADAIVALAEDVP